VFFSIVLLIAMAATFIVLVMGVVGMIHQGPFNSKWSNKLMRFRVLFQLAALILLGLAFLVGP
jgi:ABC-type dipeptide/oligopeptide/nickel transport system permease subunit